MSEVSRRRMMDLQARSPLVSRLPRPRSIGLSWEAALFAGLALAALGLRLWELDGRAMHYDEAIHLHYAWRLAIGDGYSHSAWMHGPFQIHLTALIFKLFSDSDFTARLAYAFFGSALVGLPFFLRTYLGRTGAVVTSVMLALSPSLLYFSRFGRNDILMVFWAVALLTLMWRYVNEGKNRYLYMASAVLALAFATKETSYILVGIFGAALFIMSLPEILPWVLGRIRLSDLTGAPVFLILLVTLTLPQWAALTSIFQDIFGIVIANTEGGTGEVGLPRWAPPLISFPLVSLPTAVNYLVIAAIAAIPLGLSIFTKTGRRTAKWLLPAAALAAVVYAFISLPEGLVARNYIIPLCILAGTLTLSALIGVMWKWKVWLLCAGIFYTIWIMLYTTVFSVFVRPHGFCPPEAGGFGTLCSKLGGVFTGSWQGLGYWVAQHEVSRGNQPWYYHFIIGSVYEFLPLLLGLIAIAYFLRKGDLFGLLLAFWATLTFLAYTIAGEKMPWLVVNVAVPFILLAGKFMGEIIDRVHWRRVLRSAPSALLLLAPLLLVAVIYLLDRYLEQGTLETKGWGLLAGIIGVALAIAFLVKRARPGLGMTLATLGVAALMLGFSSFVAFRASYSYDDSPLEMLVYAQGSADLKKVAETLGTRVIADGERERVVDVDRELWYPFNWYVRQEDEDGALGFRCYKDEKEDGHTSACNPLEDVPSYQALLLNKPHGNRDSTHLGTYEKTGPFRNLLWFPEGYRRPGENRQKEGKFLGVLPSGEQVSKDFEFAKDNITRREPWKNSLDYFLFRRMGTDWLDYPNFFAYIAPDAQAEEG